MTIDPNLAILRPVVVLVAWTIVMLAWLIATRIPAMKAAGVDLNRLIGGKGTDADGVLPAKAQWKAHNYNHLMEQPTLFYAIAITLVLIGQGSGVNTALAWAYVGLRVLHSLVQATWNRVAVRFVLFMLSSLALIALTLHAAIALFAG
jgi:hypothetical protein